METYVLIVDRDPADSTGALVTLVHWSAAGGPLEVQRDVSPMSLGAFTAQGIRDKVAPGQDADPELGAVGQQLYNMLAVGQVATPLNALIKSNVPARVVLDVRPNDWQELPWELARQDNRALFARPKLSWCRGRLDQSRAFPPIEWPLRILIVIGSRPGDKTVNAEEEVRRILLALDRVDEHVDVLITRQPGRAQLQTLLNATDGPQPHIFHYIGHGGTPDVIVGVPPGDPWLRIYNCPTPDCAAGSEEDWTATEIFNFFDVGHKPNLVILNACRSASFAQQGLNSISAKLIEAGVPAVLGMRADVEPDDAIRFSEAFYTALADGQALDEAVATARSKILGATPGSDQRPEWAAPILEVRASPGDLITLPTSPQPVIPPAREFTILKRAVDRRPDRFSTWQKVHAQKRHVFAIVGRERIGKTWFATIVMARCILAGWRVRYVDLSQDVAILPLDLLLRIADGDGSDTPLTRPLEPTDLFAPFRQQLQVDRGTAEAVVSDREKLDAYERIFKPFRDALAKTADIQPLVIVIDYKALATRDNDKWHFERVLLPKLFNWVAERSEHTIVLTLVVRTEDYSWLLERGLAGAQECAVQGFPGNEYEDLAWEWVRRNLPPPVNPVAAEAELRKRIQSEKGSIGLVWTPEEFDGVAWHAKKAGYRNV